MVKALEQMRGRHGDSVRAGLVIGFAALVTQIDRDRGEERVEFRLAAFRLDQIERGNRMEPFGQALDLVGIEHRIGLQHPARFVRLLAGVGGFDLLSIALVEDCDGRLRAFTDLRPQALGLIIGHPIGRGVAAHIRDHPQPEHVHAAVRNPAGPQGTGDRDTAPRLDPRLRACFQTGDDFLGDARGGRHAAALPLAIGHDGSPD